YREIITATSQILADQTNPGSECKAINDPRLEDYTCLVNFTSKKEGIILIVRRTYPISSAIAVSNAILDAFKSSLGSDVENLGKDEITVRNIDINFAMEPLLVKYENLNEADKLAQLENQLEDVKVLM
ncbi:MAG: hypothetical protein MHPSP_003277, partial [Paramarteilia canceri]